MLDTISDLMWWISPDAGVYQDAGATIPADGQGDVIALQQDQSGHANHVSQATSGYRPTLDIVGGIPLIKYDGVDDYLLSASYTIPSQAPLTIISICSTDQLIPISYPAVLAMQTNGWRFAQFLGYSCMVFISNGLKNYIGGLPSFRPNVLALFVVTFNETYDVTIWNNRRFNAYVTYNANSNPSPGEFRVGRGFATNQAWSGHLGDQAVYNRVLTAAEIANIEDYLAAKYSLSLWEALNASAALWLPTYYSTYDPGQVVHPDVLYFPNGWQNHKYWMVGAPFPLDKSQYENASIWISETGQAWAVPDGLTNPIDPYPGSPLSNSDPDFLVGPDNVMYCLYRESNVPADTHRLLLRTSTDGVTWSAEAEVLTFATGTFTSQALIWDGTQYVLYSVNHSAYPYQVIERRTAAAVDGPWSDPVTCTFANPPAIDFNMWHINVILRDDSIYAMLLTQQTKETNFDGDFILTSTDGLEWTFDEVFNLHTPADPAAWDYGLVYRGSLVWEADHYRIWYSARTPDKAWGVGYAEYYPEGQMAYASAVALTIYEIERAGESLEKNLVTPTATHGNKAANDGKMFFYVKNASGGDITVTIDTPGTVDSQTIADLVVTVKATGDANGLDKQLIGPFTSTFSQSDGYVWAVCSATTSVSIGAFRLP